MPITAHIASNIFDDEIISRTSVSVRSGVFYCQYYYCWCFPCLRIVQNYADRFNFRSANWVTEMKMQTRPPISEYDKNIAENIDKFAQNRQTELKFLS